MKLLFVGVMLAFTTVVKMKACFFVWLIIVVLELGFLGLVCLLFEQEAK